MLVIKGIYKKVRDVSILNNVYLAVAKGSVAVLLGPSGVGKSTLLRVLNNLESYDSGYVMLDEKQIEIAQVHQTHTVGLVFQHFNLFEHLTALENITLALTHVLHKSQQEAEAIATQLLAQYGLLDKAHQYPTQLSGGQKQRLAIARTLALRPSIICFDEPTSALDPLLVSTVAQTINDLAAHGYYCIVATHDISLLTKLKGMVHLMEKGAIVESAPIGDLHINQTEYPRITKFIRGHV